MPDANVADLLLLADVVDTLVDVDLVDVDVTDPAQRPIVGG